MEQDVSKSEDTHDISKACCSEAGAIPEEAGEQSQNEQSLNKQRFLGICIVIAAVIIGGAIIYTSRFNIADKSVLSAKVLAALEKTLLPDKGVLLPVKWGDLGKQLVDNGSIDKDKFEALYSKRGGLDEATKNLLTGADDGQLVITKDNASSLLNLFWAFGLANKNTILEKGPMMDKQYGGAGNFASTGGWTLAVGSPMNHYSRHSMIPLTSGQQALVERVSQNIYRPCCGNSTYFPDCNHGMAMLGLLELMASQGVSENDMYKAALAVNSYWFPDTYVTIAQYLKTKGMAWKDVSAKGILGKEFSSTSGYQQIKNQINPSPQKGGSCGV